MQGVVHTQRHLAGFHAVELFDEVGKCERDAVESPGMCIVNRKCARLCMPDTYLGCCFTFTLTSCIVLHNSLGILQEVWTEQWGHMVAAKIRAKLGKREGLSNIHRCYFEIVQSIVPATCGQSTTLFVCTAGGT